MQVSARLRLRRGGYAFAQSDSFELLPFLAAYRLIVNPMAAVNNIAATEAPATLQARSLGTSESIIATIATPMGAAAAIARKTTKTTCPIPHIKASDSLCSLRAEYSGCLNGVTLRRITIREPSRARIAAQHKLDHLDELRRPTGDGSGEVVRHRLAKHMIHFFAATTILSPRAQIKTIPQIKMPRTGIAQIHGEIRANRNNTAIPSNNP